MPKPEKTNAVSAPNKAKDKINQHLYQQSFLGASITNFSINLGLNSSASTLNVSLVEDDLFKRNPNAVLEGYHPWDVHAFPIELYDKTRKSGVTVGVPCDPNSCVGDVRPWVHCDCTDTIDRRVSEKVPDYLIRGDMFFKPEVGAPVYFNYKMRNFEAAHPDYIPATGADRYDYSDKSVFEFNGILKSVKRDYTDRGITYSVEVEDPRQILEDTIVLLGEKFIKPVAPPDRDFPIEVASFHDGQGLRGGGVGNTAADRPIPNARFANHDYVGYYNILNVYGYYEFAWKRPNVEGTAELDNDGSKSKYSSGKDALAEQNGNVNGRFGNAEFNSSGMVWYDPARTIDPPFGCTPEDSDPVAHLGTGKFEQHARGILPALDFMLMARDECYKRINEPMGGPVYYALDNLNTGLNAGANAAAGQQAAAGAAAAGSSGLDAMVLGAGSDPLNKKIGYRYKVDLTDLYNLHKTTNPPVAIEEDDGQGGKKQTGTMGGGNLDSSLKINESQTTLLSLIQTITEAAGADFFVELIRDPEPGTDTPFGGKAYHEWEGKALLTGPSKQDSTYAGIIKVWVIPRAHLDFVVPHIVGDSIDEALDKKTGWWTEEQFSYEGNSLGFREPIITNANVGYEFNNIYTGAFMLGGPRTRVVGVTPQGELKYRPDQGFDWDNDPTNGVNLWTEEYLPSTELDGAKLGYVTGSWPKDYYDETGNGRARGGFCAGANGKQAAGLLNNPITDKSTCEQSGKCSDPTHIDEGACEGAGGTWTAYKWVIGYSNDEYRAWSNNFHPFDEDEGIIKSDMDRLNQPSRGKCTANEDETEGDDDKSDKNSGESCEGEGSCYKCYQAGSSGAVHSVEDKKGCDDASGNWTTSDDDEDSQKDCQDADGIWITSSFQEGDGYIDIYPMWGFKTENKELLETNSDGFIKTSVRGDPIKGFFNDDDPYRDFDVADGIYSNKQYFDRHEGVCSDPSAIFVPKNPHQLVNNKKHMEACLFSKTTVVENGEEKDKKVATGNTYTLFCYDPYGRKEIDLKSGQTGKCTNYTCPEEDGCDAPTNKECCEAISGTWEADGDSIVTSTEVDIDVSRCTFYREPDPKNWIEGMKQEQAGGCANEEYNSKKECDENATCIDGEGNDVTADLPDRIACINEGTCIKTTQDEDGNETGEQVEGNRQECVNYCCVNHPDDKHCATEFMVNQWTGWNEATGELVRPYTATIPINLEVADYNHGPSDSEHYYYTTVTELRHAATGQDAWFKYMRNYDSWLPCKMGWKECIMNDSLIGGLKHAMEAFFGVGEPNFPVRPPVMRPADSGDTNVEEHNDLIPYACEGTRNDLSEEEEKKMQKNFSFRVVNEVATNYYGRTFLMSLPYAPPLHVGCSGNDTCQCCKDENGGIQSYLQDKDSCEQQEGYTWETPCEKGGSVLETQKSCEDNSAIWLKFDTQEKCEEHHHKWSSYGIQSEWTYASSTVGIDKTALVTENRWDIANGGWPFNTAGHCHDYLIADSHPDCANYPEGYCPAAEVADKKREQDCIDYALAEAAGNFQRLTEIVWIEDFPEFESTKNLRYPGHQNFWDSDGNLTAFVAFPRTEIQRLSHLDHKLSFRQLNPETFYHAEHSDITDDASKDGTVFVKVEVDPKTYWLPETPTWELQHGKTYERFCYDEDDEIIEGALGDYRSRSRRRCEEELLSGDPTGYTYKGKKIASSFLRPYALITLPSSVKYDRPDTYNDKRAQLHPEGETFDDDCHADIRKARCEKAGAFYLAGEDATYGDAKNCTDNDGVWIEADAMHNCGHHPGCHWQGGAHCVDPTGEIVPHVNKEGCEEPGTCSDTEHTDRTHCEEADETWTSTNSWVAEGRCRAKERPSGGKCIDPDGVDQATADAIDNEAECVEQAFEWVLNAEGKKSVRGVTVCIPLTKVGDSRTADANLIAAINNMFHHPVHMRTGADINKAPMVSAAFKPYYAGVPQQSNVYYWGAWARGKGYGKLVYINDSSYHPGIFGSEGEMNFAANARCLADVSDFKVSQEMERGSVSLVGPPFYDIGTHITFSKLPIPAVLPPELAGHFAIGPPATPYFGPVITDMSVDVGPGGINTTYNMQLNPKFGNMQKIQEQRMREHAKKIMSLRQKQEEELQRSRLPDPQQFRR